MASTIICLFNTLAGLQVGAEERYKLPSGVWGGALAEIEFGAFSLKM